MLKNIFYTFLLLLIFLAAACRQPTPQENKVTIQVSGDADMLNPVLYRTDLCSQLSRLIFQTLLTPDFKSLEIIPVLAIKRPEMEMVNGKLQITYEIRPEATWDNGQPITARDAEFSLKVIKNPKSDAQRMRSYFDFIDSILFYPENPRKFTFVCKEYYIRAELMSGDFAFLPQYVYDSTGLMNEFTIYQLNNPTEEEMNNPHLSEFAEQFSAVRFQREKEYVRGSGAYQLEEWVTGQRIILKKKENWWGEQIKNTHVLFDAYPTMK